MAIWTIIVGAGSGTRFGGPKQYRMLGDRRVLDHSIATARAVSDGLVLVVSPDRAGDPEPSVDAVVAGGSSRSASVRAGMAEVPPDAEVVLVHDAARPLADIPLYRRVLDALDGGAVAVVPGMEVVDTMRRRSGGVVDRSELVAVQTPQGFRASVLRDAHAHGDDATDDAGLVERSGQQVVVVEGARSNLKITDPADLAIAATLLDERGDHMTSEHRPDDSL